jgi:hypothetical protein
MLNTPLHGARWLWFGPTSLGRNDWQDFGTVLVMGREDVGVDAIEDYGRAFFGDTGEPLDFVKPDAKGQKFMPNAILPLAMENGESWGIHGRAHPDPRIRSLQMQTRELAARQAIERLRLVNAKERKRVVICSTVPVPGLPVSELVSWADIVPSRLQAAIAEAAQNGGVLRFSASGLCSDAPNEFQTLNSAKHWLKRGGQAEIEDLRGHTGNIVLLPARPLNFVTLRQDAKGARATRAIVLGADAHAIAERAIGPLSIFDVEEPRTGEKVAPPRVVVRMDGNRFAERVEEKPLMEFAHHFADILSQEQRVSYPNPPVRLSQLGIPVAQSG